MGDSGQRVVIVNREVVTEKITFERLDGGQEMSQTTI